MKTAILIPAYQPTDDIINVVNELSKHSFMDIVVVDDGSNNECQTIFNKLKNKKGITLITHPENMGKGAALKTGLEYIKTNIPDCVGVVTADADGQHSVEDIIKVAKAVTDNPEALVLGVRHFGDDIPLRSKFGNKLTRLIMRIFFGIKVSDTQTGLRAIPTNFIDTLLEIKYDKYEFEIEMLIRARKNKIEFTEVPIQTIYIDNNASSHFNPVVDSMKIYFVLFRHMFSAIVSALVDYVVFIIVHYSFHNLIVSTYSGRAVSLVVNFFLLKKFTFHSHRKNWITMLLYLSQVAVMTFITFLLIDLLEKKLGVRIEIAKIIVEVSLYPINFLVQKKWIFKEK